MLRPLIFIIVLISVESFAFSQTVSDQEETASEGFQVLTDSTRVSSLLRAGKDLLYSDTRASIPYFDSVATVASRAGLSEQQYIGRNLEGVAHCILGEMDLGFQDFHTALSGFERIGSDDGRAQAISNLASAHRLEGTIDSAYYYLLESVLTSKVSGDMDRLAQDYSNLSGFFIEISDFERAEEYVVKCLALSGYIEDEETLAIIYQEMGIIKTQQGDPESAKKAYGLAMEYAESTNDERLKALLFAGSAAVYGQMGDQEAARKWYEQALQLQEKVGARSHIAGMLRDYGAYESTLGNGQKADSLLTLSLKITRSIGSDIKRIGVLHVMAENDLRMGWLDSAYVHANESLAMADEKKSIHDEIISIDLLMRIHSAHGDPLTEKFFRSALAEKKKSIEEDENVLNQSLTAIAERAEGVEKSGQGMNQEEVERNQLNLKWPIILSICLIVLSFGFIVKRFLKHRRDSV